MARFSEIYIEKLIARDCKCANVQMCKCANVQLCKCADVQMCRCADLQMYRCANVQMFRCANVQMCKCADVQMYKCATCRNSMIFTYTCNLANSFLKTETQGAHLWRDFLKTYSEKLIARFEMEP